MRAGRTKRDRTRRALLQAAEATFGSRGWARTRIEDVAAEAGVSVTTAYNHFPSKHALIGHVFEPLVRPLVVRAERDAASGRPVVEALQDQVRAVADLTVHHHGLTVSFWCAVQDHAIRRTGPVDPDDVVDPRALAPLPDALRILVEHGQAGGQLRRHPPAAVLARVLVEVLLARAVTEPGESAADRAALVLTLLFGALRPELLIGHDGRPRPP